jgi:hypothetical protein
MGYNISRLPTVYHAVYHRNSRFGGPDVPDVPVRVSCDGAVVTMPLADLPNLDFVKPRHWERASIPSFRPPTASASSTSAQSLS